MRYEYAVWSHIVVGAVALAFFWAAFSSRKGSAEHRWRGRRFFVAMLATVVTVPPVVLMRPEPFDPGRIVALVYLSLCVASVVTLAWTAVRWKDHPDHFRGFHLKALGVAITLLGALVLMAGGLKGDPVAVVLSWVGLSFGPAMLYFAWKRGQPHPLWWLSWHLSAVCGLMTAVHGTLLFVAWRWLLAPQADRADAAIFHAAVLVVGLLMRGWWGRRRGVPWGFFEPGQSAPTAQRRAEHSPL